MVRGDDLLPTTPRQLLLYRALGLQPPRFFHTPLVVGPDGRRLAKRHGDTRISAFREAGWKPETVIALLARISGLAEPGETALRLPELLPRFQWSRIPKAPVVMTEPRDLFSRQD